MKNKFEQIVTNCPKCGSDNIEYQLTADNLTGSDLSKKALGFAIFGWLSFAKPPSNDDKSTTYLFCKKCGYKQNKTLQKKKAADQRMVKRWVIGMAIFALTMIVVANYPLHPSEIFFIAIIIISIITVKIRKK